jgi:hypothetical protein
MTGHKLKDECEGIAAPDGWKFQDCEESFVSLLRQRDVDGGWTVDDWGSSGGDLRDNYISAEYHANFPAPGLHMWEVVAFDRSSGHGLGPRRASKEDAVKEAVCLARFDDEWDRLREEGVGYTEVREKAMELLSSCRRDSGLR